MRVLLATIVAFASFAIVPAPTALGAETHEQVITVSVRSSKSTTGTLEAWQREGSTFTRVRGPIPVYIGRDGLGKASETRARTPRGVFGISEAFGTARDPGTELPYTRVGRSHWWVSDVRSPHYNTMRVCRAGSWCGFRQSRSERLGTIPVYRYAIVFDYNRDPIKQGAGSAFFLHLSEGKPTAGCVSMARKDLLWLMRWLDPAADPVISLGVKSAAYSPL